MGSIRKLPDGRWQARHRPYPGARQISKTGRRRVDVSRWLEEQITAATTGQYADPRAGRITARNYYTAWADRQLWTTGSRDGYNTALLSAPWMDKPIGRIRRSDIETWIKRMSAGVGYTRPLADQTVRDRAVKASNMFGAAVRDRIIPHNPADDIRLPISSHRATTQFPTAEQVAAILDAANETMWYAFIATAAFAGLRVGEVSALRVNDIVYLKRIIRVDRQVQNRHGRDRIEYRKPKYGSTRTVWAADELLEILAHHIERFAPGDNLDRLVFPWKGDAVPQRTAQANWRRYRDAANVGEHIRYHSLRHFYASGLIAAGCDVVTVQHALGHRSASVTLGTYAGLWPTAEDRTRQAASELVRRTGTGPGTSPAPREATGTVRPVLD